MSNSLRVLDHGRRNDIDVVGATHLDLDIKGDGNTVYVGRQGHDSGGPCIRIVGSGNTVRIGALTGFEAQTEMRICGDGNLLEIGNRCRGRFSIDVEDASALRIGDDTSSIGTQIAAGEGRQVVIGRDCMFSVDVWIATTDSHGIFDLESGERINFARDVTIGDHVWLARDAKVLKGSQIGPGSVIGAAAVVSGAIPENCVAVGSKARVIRTNIRWKRDRAKDAESSGNAPGFQARASGSIE